MISEKSHHACVPAVPPGGPIGEILVKAGKISPADLPSIAARQKNENLLFGEAAVKMGLVTEKELSWALSVQFSFPGIIPADGLVSGEVITAHRPSGPEAEAFRSIRSALMLAGAADRVRAISVVSPGEGEGRTFVAANLAVTFAHLGARTLIADFNFRAPRIHEIFRVKNNCGASSLLIKRADLERAVHETAMPSLHVLASGPRPPNPVEILGWREAGLLISTLKKAYDVVIVDTPAFLKTSDAAETAPLTDGALLIASRGRTAGAAFGAVKKQLDNSGCPVIGAIMNQPAKTAKGKRS